LTTDVQLRNEIRDLLKELDRQAAAQGATSFADASADLQVTLLKAIEGTALFQNLVFAVVADFYNRHLVWEAIGYPGLAQRDGQGYLNRGFDVLDWDKPAV